MRRPWHVGNKKRSRRKSLISASQKVSESIVDSDRQMPPVKTVQVRFQLSSKLPRQTAVLRSFFPAVPGLKAVQSRRWSQIPEPPTDGCPRGNFSSSAPSEFFVGERSVRVFTHRFHVKTGAINFGRAAVESLVPPYFHTQGGLQKYVGGATCDVTCVRGLVEGPFKIALFFLENIVHLSTHRGPGKKFIKIK